MGEWWRKKCVTTSGRKCREDLVSLVYRQSPPALLQLSTMSKMKLVL
jgi:hypothetical protein